MKKYLILPLIVVGLLWIVSCRDAPSSSKQTILTGKMKVLVDESLEPIMREQQEVFDYSYSNADIELIVKPENQVANDLISRKAEVAVMTRLLHEYELKFFEERSLRPRIHKFALDAVVFINNIRNSDSVITAEEIFNTLRGKEGPTLVFDNANSGTVRYLREAAGVDSLPQENVYALKTSRDVFHYIHEHRGAIGVLGLNWLATPDSALTPLLADLRVLKVRNIPGELGDDGYYAPSQSNLATGHYAFSRPVYWINAEPHRGLGIGFGAFLVGDRGQRIILKSGLMPDSLPPRELIIRRK